MRLVNELDAIKNKTHKTGGKKMKKKKVFALMMAATLALSLAGCGGSSSGDSKSSGSSDSSSVANKDKPLCWFNRQPSNSSTGELDKEALNFNKDTYYVGFDANQGAELQGEMVVVISKQMLIRLTEMVMELSDTYLQSVTSDIMILSHVHVVFVRHLEQELKMVTKLLPSRQEQT